MMDDDHYDDDDDDDDVDDNDDDHLLFDSLQQVFTFHEENKIHSQRVGHVSVGILCSVLLEVLVLCT